jgi:hypothetical protein
VAVVGRLEIRRVFNKYGFLDHIVLSHERRRGCTAG